jgi:ribose 5-phosphate isomerase A
VSAIAPGTRAALDLVRDGQTIGLGTGRAAAAFVRGLGVCVADGLRVRAVPTSESTAALAESLGIPLLTLAAALVDVGALDTTFDGADEVDPNLDLIKGYGGALVREKIVAAASSRLVILVGPEKRVAALGERGKLPVEVIPFGVPVAAARLRALGCEPTVRETASGPFVTDNGNTILDCKVSPLDAPTALESAILAIPGVLGRWPKPWRRAGRPSGRRTRRRAHRRQRRCRPGN